MKTLFLDKFRTNNFFIFLFFWLVVFIFYYPTAQAGWVSDTTGWLKSIQNDSFLDYMNRVNFGVKSLYQFTQFNTFLLFKLLGKNRVYWHFIFITLHSLVCFLVYVFSRNVFVDSQFKNAKSIAFFAALIYATNPYQTEVVIWKACFHYLQGNIIILSVLIALQKYIYTQSNKYIWLAVILYFLSTFSHEFFYLTPWLVLATIIYYKSIGVFNNHADFKKQITHFFIPLISIFILHLGLYVAVYGFRISHIGIINNANMGNEFLYRPLNCLFHLTFYGRFWEEVIKIKCYHILKQNNVILTCYFLLLLALFSFIKFRTTKNKKVELYLLVCFVIAFSICIPLWTFEMFEVWSDRYNYLMLIFWSMFVSAVLFSIPKKSFRVVLLAIPLIINIFLLIRTNKHWKESVHIIDKIQTTLPDNTGKTIIILNVPICYNGILMVGSSREGEFRLQHNLLYSNTNDSVLDAVSYNMLTPNDGAHVMVVNDSTIKVTLNQWGTWWWDGLFGAKSYENIYYKLNMIDGGHWYELNLKKNPNNYLLFYQVGDSLKKVNWSIKNEDQW